jgi:hypothetical protein
MQLNTKALKWQAARKSNKRYAFYSCRFWICYSTTNYFCNLTSCRENRTSMRPNRVCTFEISDYRRNCSALELASPILHFRKFSDLPTSFFFSFLDCHDDSSWLNCLEYQFVQKKKKRVRFSMCFFYCITKQNIILSSGCSKIMRSWCVDSVGGSQDKKNRLQVFCLK